MSALEPLKEMAKQEFMFSMPKTAASFLQGWTNSVFVFANFILIYKIHYLRHLI